MPQPYKRTSARKKSRDHAQFFRWWQHKHKAVKTNENTSRDYSDVQYIDANATYMNTSNTTSAHASNTFQMKQKILGDIAARRVPSAQPITTVIVIASIFLFITMSITAATVVFCKKKNTVFVLNKSEQEDTDYEMEEINQTDIEYADFGSELSLNRLNKSSSSVQTVVRDEIDQSPTRHPLVSEFDESDDTKYLLHDMPYRTRTLCEHEQQGYRRLVVSAVVEKPTGPVSNADSENEESPYRAPNLGKQRNKGFYRLTMMPSDAESDYENSPTQKRHKRETKKPCSCACANSGNVNWENIQIVPRDGEEFMLYESEKCRCVQKCSRTDQFESIPLDNVNSDSATRGRYRKVPNVVESPFHSRSPGGATKVNENVPPRSHDSDPGDSVHVTPNGVNFFRTPGKSPTCKVHGASNSDNGDLDLERQGQIDGQGRRRYVLYELPSHRNQGTNTGVTVSTQTDSDGTPPDGERLNQIVINPGMSSVQTIPLENNSSSSVILEEMAPPHKGTNPSPLFHDQSQHSQLCLSLMSPTEMSAKQTSPKQTSDSVSPDKLPVQSANQQSVSKYQTIQSESSRHLSKINVSEPTQTMTPPKIPPRKFELQFKDNYSSVHKSTSQPHMQRTESPTAPPGVRNVTSPNNIHSPSQTNFTVTSPLMSPVSFSNQASE